MDEELDLAAPARGYGDWRGALGLPDLAAKARTLRPETALGRAVAETAPDSGPGALRPPLLGSRSPAPWE